jgi:hypothetical protein
MRRTKEDPKYDIQYDKPVFVYRNLHKKCWSIKQSGLVKAHSESVHLKDCNFLVSQAGRDRVLKEKRKNVHAGIKGILTYHTSDSSIRQNEQKKEVTYNPYKYNSFVDKATEKQVTKANMVVMDPRNVYYE